MHSHMSLSPLFANAHIRDPCGEVSEIYPAVCVDDCSLAPGDYLLCPVVKRLMARRKYRVIVTTANLHVPNQPVSLVTFIRRPQGTCTIAQFGSGTYISNTVLSLTSCNHPRSIKCRYLVFDCVRLWVSVQAQGILSEWCKLLVYEVGLDLHVSRKKILLSVLIPVAAISVGPMHHTLLTVSVLKGKTNRLKSKHLHMCFPTFGTDPCVSILFASQRL